MHNRMPRHYAFAYLEAKGDKDKEREAVAGCPKEWRELVRMHAKLIQEKDAMRVAK
jgi:hypothetical protein